MIFLSSLVKNSIYLVSVICKLDMKWYLMCMCVPADCEPLRPGKYFEWRIKQLLNSAFVGYEEFCKSRRVLSTGEREESLQWSLRDSSSASFSAWLIFYLASWLHSTEIATVAHSKRKTRRTQADISVKKSENYCLKILEWEQLFRTLITRIRRKN